MLTFSNLLKAIRSEAGLTQEELAGVLGVHKMLIAMIENETRQPTRKFVAKLSEALDVHPLSITPFLEVGEETSVEELSPLERKVLQIGERLQTNLIRKKAKLLNA